MRQSSHIITQRALAYALAAAVASAVTGVAFALWLENAPGIFMAMVDSTLAWCF